MLKSSYLLLIGTCFLPIERWMRRVRLTSSSRTAADGFIPMNG